VDKFVCQYLRIRPLEHIDVSSSLFSLHRSHISQAMAALIRSIGVDPEVAPPKLCVHRTGATATGSNDSEGSDCSVNSEGANHSGGT
jgi:hypothetical protein